MLSVIVVGAGIAGVTFGITLARHPNTRVTILEQAAVMDKAGNGIQVPCNAAHAMRCLGLLDKLLAKTKRPASSFLSLNYSDGRVLCNRDLSRCQELYGSPWLLVHRADYMAVLLDEAQRLGVEIRVGCKVVAVDFDPPAVSLPDGQQLRADVVVGCDGIKSTIRRLMHPTVVPFATGQHAYRILFSREQLLLSSSTSPLASEPGTTRCWLGPHANIVFYPVQDDSLFNLVIPIADESFHHSCPEGDVLPCLRAYFRTWDLTIRDLLGAATSVTRFPILQLPPIPHWSRGCVTLMGDAAHAMVPHLAQGAATSVEDAFILGTLLGRLASLVVVHLPRHSSSDTPKEEAEEEEGKRRVRTVLASYEKLQHERTARIAAGSRLTGTLDRLLPGIDQRARDAEFATYDAEQATCVSAFPWLDARTNMALLGRKVDEVARREFRRLLDAGELLPLGMGGGAEDDTSRRSSRRGHGPVVTAGRRRGSRL